VTANFLATSGSTASSPLDVSGAGVAIDIERDREFLEKKNYARQRSAAASELL
jgi:hypothetical protein